MPIPTARRELWRRIEAHRFDDPSARLTFTGRLARENGWTIGRACRVVKEYRRFCFLATVAGHAVTPSEDVDQAWHLHLLYTRDYWETFCGEVLRTPLHHGPTRGGEREAARYDGQYRATLATYEHTFDETPPHDIWPDVEQRFGSDLACRRVNVARNWVIPKPRWLRHRQRPRIAVAAVAMPVPLIMAGFVNPLDLRGGDFLWLFGVLAMGAVAAGVVLKRLFHPVGDDVPTGLDPLEIALLANDGRLRFAAAALAQLARPDANGNSLTLVDQLPDTATPLLTRLHERLVASGSSDSIAMLRAAMQAAAEEEEPRLRDMGLLTGAWLTSPPPWLAIAPAAAVLGLGIAKIVVGISRDKPVGFLVAGCVILTAIATCLLWRPRRTRAGERLFTELRNSFRQSEERRQWDAKLGTADVAPLAIALLGVGTLYGTPWDPIRASAARMRMADGGAGGCGTAGCGGGGDGGGGCGGCGGCGGGD